MVSKAEKGRLIREEQKKKKALPKKETPKKSKALE